MKKVLMVGTYEQLQEAIQVKLEMLRDIQTMYFDEEPDTTVEDQLINELYGEYEIFTQEELRELEEMEEAEREYYEEMREVDGDILYGKDVE
jgi:hypothetical protein